MRNLTLKLIFLALFITENNSADAQAPNFLWAQQAGGTDNDLGRGIATDGSVSIN